MAAVLDTNVERTAVPRVTARFLQVKIFEEIKFKQKKKEEKLMFRNKRGGAVYRDKVNLLSKNLIIFVSVALSGLSGRRRLVV